MMSEVAVQTQEYKCGCIGRENVDVVPLGITATAYPVSLTPSLAEERPVAERPTQRIGCGIAEAATVS